MTQDGRSSKKPAGSGLETGTATERLLRMAGKPLTRQNYLNLAYLGEPPEELSAEEEAELPEKYRQRR